MQVYTLLAFKGKGFQGGPLAKKQFTSCSINMCWCILLHYIVNRNMVRGQIPWLLLLVVIAIRLDLPSDF